MERFFKLKERGTTVRTEFIAGMTTFFSMVYILMVNAGMFANPNNDGNNPLGVSYGAIYIATALSDAIATTAGAICGTSTVTTFSEVNAALFVATLLLTR